MKKFRFILFCFVGLAGFIVDLAVALALIKALSMHFFAARSISWITAMSSTFLLNSAFSFRVLSRILSKKTIFIQTYISYFLSQLIGGLVSISVFMITTQAGKYSIATGVIFGTLCGLAVNYLGASRVLVSEKR